MLIRKAFRFQLRTDAALEHELRKASGCVRFVWNRALAMQKERLGKSERCLSYPKMTAELVLWKKAPETSFLQEGHSQALQQILKDLDRALKDAFDKKSPKRFPKFKKKGVHDSFRFPQGTKLDGDRIYLPKFGWVRFRKSREVEGKIKNVTVSRHLEHWYISVQTEMEIGVPVHPSTSAVGIDLGVAKLATLSTGEVIQPLNSFRGKEKQLARAQRALARKKKFSNNWKKQKAKIARLHARIADARKDLLHKTSTTISKNHAVVVLEDLRVKNMSASAKGTLEKPGKNVRAKAGLNKSILDQGWFELRRQLEYKEAWLGGQVIVIEAHHTSQRCSACGHVSPNNRLSQAIFACEECGHRENADLNAAKNILAAGHAVIACGEVVRPVSTKAASGKQEPTERVAKNAKAA